MSGQEIIPKRGHGTLIIIIAVVLLLVGGAACRLASDLLASVLDPCPHRLAEYNQLREMEARFLDAQEVAENTPQLGLAGVITDMQDIRRQAADLELSECAREAHEALLTFMDNTLEANLAILADKDNVIVSSYSNTAALWYNLYKDAMARFFES